MSFYDIQISGIIIYITIIDFRSMDVQFLPFRCWIGLWTTLLLIVIVAFDLSACVKYITRFTEESFACLITIIFIVGAFKKLAGLQKVLPINMDPSQVLNYDCECLAPNSSSVFLNDTLFALNDNNTLAGTAYTYFKDYNQSIHHRPEGKNSAASGN